MKNRTQHMRKNVLLLSFFLMLLTIQPMMAQPEDFDEDVDDEPATPIDGYVYAGLIAGAFIAIRTLKKAESL